MTTRRSPLVCNLLAAVTAGCLAFAALSLAAAPAEAAKKKRPPPAKEEESTARPPAVADPTPVPAPVPAPAPAPVPAPAPAPVPVPAAETAPLVDHTYASAPEGESQFAGGFFRIGLGYATSGGGAGKDLGKDWEGDEDEAAAAAVAYRTNVGAGPVVSFQGGYNILGYASIAVEVSGHGTLSSDKMKLAGGGAVATIIGIHPLRFWRADLPYDVSLYGGYTFFEVLAYNENVFQTDAKGKSWLGSGIPFGLQGEYRFKPASSFALGLDLRFTHTAYDTWIYNWDKDIKADLSDDPVTTLRFEPKLMLNWHF